ncbi:MAG: hypothetical protein NTV51_30710 [Verrucomicrobia bacterium]|nr:hypothetical protein [Verrucomicrobiota bacterium]
MKAITFLTFFTLHQLLSGADNTSLDRTSSQFVAWYFKEFELPALIGARPAAGQFAIRLIHFHSHREPEPRDRDKEVAVSISGAAGGTAIVMTHHFRPKSEWRKFTLTKDQWEELVRQVFAQDYLSAPRPLPYLAGPTFIVEVASASSYKLEILMSPDDFPGKRRITPVVRRVLDRLLEFGDVLPEEIVWGPKNDD